MTEGRFWTIKEAEASVLMLPSLAMFIAGCAFRQRAGRVFR